jgi:NAD(P)-dependent dehydrogenase (short-subunit alcohol dehydrogenase family)
MRESRAEDDGMGGLKNKRVLVVGGSSGLGLAVSRLAVELAPIRVNAVSPGFVAPKPPDVEARARRFPAGRVASAEEVAETYILLMESPYVTGTTLVVDGGARLV